MEWLGEVPEHWEVVRIKCAATLRTERRKDAPEGWSYIGLEDVEPETGRYVPTDGESRQSADSMVGVFRPRDVLYGKLRPYLRKTIITLQDGVCSTEFLVLKPVRASSSWLHLWLLTPDVTQQIEAGCDGAKMPRADWEHIGSIAMPLPPCAEQSSIAWALDRETSHIDTLISEKERLISLLQEYRQALTSHAVTKGLDPKVKMKDSGVEWLGEIPAHWNILQLKFIASMKSGEQISSDKIEEEGEYPVYGGNGLRGFTSEYTHTGFFPLIGRQGALCGNINYSQGNFWASEHAVVVSPKVECSVFWLGELLRSMNLGQYSISSAQPGLSVENISRLKIPFPPVNEQIVISNLIKCETSRIDTLISEARKFIDLLKEYRSSLITAAVTGKIDVREVVPSVSEKREIAHE